MITQCRHLECKAPIVWMITLNNKRNPVNVASCTEEEKASGLPPIFDPKRHVSHYATCPFAHEFRKKKAPAKTRKPDADASQEVLL